MYIRADDPVLIARRKTVEAYMRKMAGLIWRGERDMRYTTANGIDPEEATGYARLEIKAGRLYRGLPYTHAGGSLTGFMDYFGTAEPSGVLPLQGLRLKPICGTSSGTARLSSDCSGTVCLSWAQIGTSVNMVSTRHMVPDRGFPRVGDYESDPADNTNSKETVERNGTQRMFAAYGQLQTGDAVVCRGANSGHVMMAVDPTVVYTPDGAIDGARSTLTVLEQTRQYFVEGEHWFDRTLGEEVWAWYGVDKVYTFDALFREGYLPVTCRELIDPAPVEDMWVKDSETVFGKDTLCAGTVTSNRYLDSAVMTVTDETGAAVQQGTLYAIRSSIRRIDLTRFRTEDPDLILGKIDPEALSPGKYRCTLTIRTVPGETVTLRDFDFEI